MGSDDNNNHDNDDDPDDSNECENYNDHNFIQAAMQC